MRVLVTGGAGFIGLHTCLALKARGDEVVAIDSMDATKEPRLKEARLDRLEASGVRVVNHDIRYSLVDIFTDPGPWDAIIHLAARAGVRASVLDPADYCRVNVEGTANVLQYAEASGCSRVVYASSSSVKGCASPYAATKVATDALADAWSKVTGGTTVGLRYHTVYGPWGRPDMAMWGFADAVAAGETVKLFDHGLCTRDFTFVSDVVAATLAAVDGEIAGHHELDIGLGKPAPVRRVLEILVLELCRETRVELVGPQAGDVRHTEADIGPAKDLLGWTPAVEVDEGVPEFVRWLREWRSGKC